MTQGKQLFDWLSQSFSYHPVFLSGLVYTGLASGRGVMTGWDRTAGTSTPTSLLYQGVMIGTVKPAISVCQTMVAEH